jgi:alkylhydroperoxidase family enzyme
LAFIIGVLACPRRATTKSSGAAMAHISHVPVESADGLLAKLYAEYSGEDGMVDHIIRIHSLNPRSMKDHVQLYSHLMRGPSPLTRIQREMLAVTVSAENDCFY